MNTTVKQRVAAGAAVLDQIYPEWPALMVVAGVEVGSMDACPLAVCFGHYADGIDHAARAGRPSSYDYSNDADDPGEWDYNHGFDSAVTPGDFERLDREWMRLARERVAAS